MAFSYGFYNAIDDDRSYNVHQFNDMFAGFIGKGIYATINDGFAVRGNSEEGVYGVIVSSGRAFFNSLWVVNDDESTLLLNPIASGNPRIDAVVLTFDNEQTAEGRKVYLRVIEGTAAANPEPPDVTALNTSNVHNYTLALIRILPGATSITATEIEHKVGTSDIPYSLGMLQSITMDDKYSSWKSEFNTWLTNLQAAVTEEAIAQYETRINNVLTQTEILDSVISNLNVEIGNIYTDRWFFKVFRSNGSFTVPANVDTTQPLMIYAIGGSGGGSGGGAGGIGSEYSTGSGAGGAGRYRDFSLGDGEDGTNYGQVSAPKGGTGQTI